MTKIELTLIKKLDKLKNFLEKNDEKIVRKIAKSKDIN